MARATVIIPTFDHGPMLSRSARSAMGQTVEDIEILIIGDGVPDITREIAAELQKEDGRVKFLDNLKDARNGEVYRHAALQEARGGIVCYLSDDDLWLPNHVEYMEQLLQGADFAGALHVWGDLKGDLHPGVHDLSMPVYRNLMLSKPKDVNRVPLSGGAHTMEMYRRLPHGWRTSPREAASDLYMWQQFLSIPECRAVSGTRPTLMKFPSPSRREWSDEQRLAELDHWSEKISDPEWLRGFPFMVMDKLALQRAREWAMLNRYRSVGATPDQVRERLLHLDAIQSSRSWKLLRRINYARSRLMGKR